MKPTNEQVLQWAREAGYETDRGPLLAKHASIKVGGLCVGLHPMLDRFAAFAYTAGRNAGLERAAEVCEQKRDKALAAQTNDPHDHSNIMLRQIAYLGAEDCAVAIRALGEDDE